MLVKSYAKINLHLKVLGINKDNYHLLQMVNTKINFYDVLKFKKTKNNINVYMANIPQEENLVYKVTKYMFEKYNIIGGINIYIKKNIMLGAGLGGGSSNAACTIHTIDKLYKLNLSIEEKRKIALKFGTDIIYCLENNPALVFGVGEKIQKFNLNKRYNVLLINPKINVSTKEVYSLYDNNNEYSVEESIKELENKNITELLYNDLEKVVFEKYQQIKKIKEELLLYSNNVLMSGSGSTVYVIDSKKVLKKILKEYKQKNPLYIYVLTKTR